MPHPPAPSEHRPRKRFGQNFLHDPGTIRRILAAVAPAPGKHLVEIGPGQGALTAGLLEAAGELDVIELDRDLVGPLAQRLGALGRLRVHQADALKFDLCALLGETKAETDASGRLRLVGNLPYNISTPLLFRFLEQARCIEDMHLMLQKEVVERLAAEPGSKSYGRLSVMVQSQCAVARVLTVGPGAFTPAPKVDSAVVRLRPLRPPPVSLRDPALHARLVAAAFSQRRKRISNSLRGLADTALMARCGLDPGSRAEQLSVADFARLANAAADAAPGCNPGINP
ncbi:MAG: 16S rRNA (adenine(1518)-N(6)/adenine(1519)-N(6))-dimethyltransferase RsmA [Thiohalocapsa sp.]|uniref:16S rRNA (adenine(1518)-N(6)/adenine(1519)-N(6))- dimethyltransferase RsmA n=1 Tax=Thiohalocapsa sp. TaxID=2497641 RepID=UPI0025D82F1E|nr:16S rRNA (adenine(1518)-N(6)/adenine(1519)-N(6))-dimethyltransferase RsmA [Thiohalocapsa sp.]MCG6943075.1 16S rRNA (adenine(1518)-N(6)/adenine(1519)-N(6))-dimethyltransferase RsmA [Thiohalocapsa sp.]